MEDNIQTKNVIPFLIGLRRKTYFFYTKATSCLYNTPRVTPTLKLNHAIPYIIMWIDPFQKCICPKQIPFTYVVLIKIRLQSELFVTQIQSTTLTLQTFPLAYRRSVTFKFLFLNLMQTFRIKNKRRKNINILMSSPISHFGVANIV